MFSDYNLICVLDADRSGPNIGLIESLGLRQSDLVSVYSKLTDTEIHLTVEVSRVYSYIRYSDCRGSESRQDMLPPRRCI